MPTPLILPTNVPHTQAHHQPTSPVTSALARDQFEILYPTIRGFLLSQFEVHSMPQDAIEYFTRVRRRPLSSLHRLATHLKDQVSRS
jgi:hypothetical protein